MKKRLDSKSIALVGILLAIVAIMSITPLGFIPLGPVNATINHIPVIIGSLVGGPLVGGLVGLGFGLISWINSFLRPTVTSFVFWNPIISVIPRIIVGIVPYYVYNFVRKFGARQKNFISGLLMVVFNIYFIYKLRDLIDQGSIFSIIVGLVLYILLMLVLYLSISKKSYNLESILAAASGSLTNTGLVMGLIYLLYGERFAATLGLSTEFTGRAILTFALVNGSGELIISIIIVSALMSRWKRS